MHCEFSYSWVLPAFRHNAPYFTCVVVLYHIDLIPFILLWIIWHNYTMHTSTFSICQEIKKFPPMHVLFNDYLTFHDVTFSMLFRFSCLNIMFFWSFDWIVFLNNWQYVSSIIFRFKLIEFNVKAIITRVMVNLILVWIVHVRDISSCTCFYFYFSKQFISCTCISWVFTSARILIPIF